MQMVSRLDLGNERTVDSIGTYYIKKINNGKPELIGTISIEDALKYVNIAMPPLPPGATPPGPPPGGGPPP